MATPEHLGTTGIPWERWRAEFLALGENAPHAFDPARFANLDAWEEQLRTRTFDLLSEPQRPRNVSVRVAGEVACNGYVRRAVEYATTGPVKVRSQVLLPDSYQKRGRLPGIVALHDCGGLCLFGWSKICEVPNPPELLRKFWQRCYEGRPFAQELARRGYAVMLPDMFGYGDRRLHDKRTVELEHSGRTFEDIAEELNDLHMDVRAGAASNTLLAAGRSTPGMVVWDDISALDALCTQPEVDAGRIGCVGLSCGGWRTVMLAALDTRIRCSVPVGWMSTLLPIVERRPTGSMGPSMAVSGLIKDADFPHIAALAAPRPLFSIQGRLDKHFPEHAVQAAWKILGDVYRRRGAEENLKTAMYDAPHCFNLAMQDEAFAWLDRRLNG